MRCKYCDIPIRSSTTPIDYCSTACEDLAAAKQITVVMQDATLALIKLSKQLKKQEQLITELRAEVEALREKQ